MTFQGTRWLPGHCSTARTIDVNCATINNRYLVPWIEALPSRSKCQFRQKVRFLEYVVSSHVVPTFKVHPALTSPRCSGQAYQQTHQLARPRLCLSLMGLMLVVVVVANRSKSLQKVIKKSSKSRRIVNEPKKLQSSEKFAKDIGSEERLPSHRSSVKELECWRNRVSSLHYSSSEIHPKNFGIKTTRELIMHVLSLLKFWRCAPEGDILAQDQDGNA